MRTPEESPHRVLIAVACYNERETLPLLLDEILEHVPEADVLVIDDASPDGTGDYCDARAKDEPRLGCHHRPGKLGLGTAILASFEHAVAHHYDLLVGLDSDLSHPPKVIPQLIAAVDEGFDVAIGSRYVKGGGIEGWPWRRKVASALVNSFAKLALGIPVRDSSGGFRCYRVRALEPILQSGLQARGYAIFEEVLLRLAQRGATFREIPYTFVDRERGESKLTAGETFKAIRSLLGLAISRFTSPSLSSSSRSSTRSITRAR